MCRETQRRLLSSPNRHPPTAGGFGVCTHSRDLGEPFDFVTWFEYSPADAELFEDLASQLRRTEEWQYVEREVDIRLQRSF